MRKILSLLMAVVLGVSTAFATTVYCKMTHSWWYADGAAVAVHYWGGAAETTWPGVRMEAVSGEEGTWSYDVPADVTGLIFVRVNGTGDIADYGAKTVDLTLPTDGKNLFTITNETPSWGAPGCNGVWSVYGEEPAQQVEKYCEKPSGHLKDPNFGDANGRVLLTIAKGTGNNVIVKVKNNAAAGNTKSGLNYLWVNAANSAGVVRYGDGTHNEADVEEVSVEVVFNEPQESYNFINIHWAYSGWEGEWAIDGLTVTAAELCEGAAPVEPTLVNGFYLIGQNGWDVAALSADLLFTANPEAEGEYVLNTTLAADQEIKVVKVENDAIEAWYPDGMGNAYTVDQNHAGATTIYFRPAGNAEWAAFGGFMYVAPTGTVAIDAIDANAPAVKVLRNGMLLIRKGDKTYNVMGEIVR